MCRLLRGEVGLLTFVENLQRFLAMRLGRADAYSIWMDRRLIGNEPFSDALLQNINQAAALIIILSPGYLQSEWCKQERNAFLEVVRNKEHAERRIFVVETRQTDRENWPAEFKLFLGYQFWEQDDRGLSKTLGFPVLDAHDNEYFSRLEHLVTDLVHLMRELVESESERPREVQQSIETRALKLTVDESAWLQEKRELGK